MTDAPNYLALLQWPAMIITVAASWFVTSRYKKNRWLGFALFLSSNLLWTIWGVHTHANALVVLQICLAILNVVGMKRSASEEKTAIARQERGLATVQIPEGDYAAPE